jgi:sensor domain CHASE-containing protein
VALLGLAQLAALMLCLGTGLYWLIRQGVRGVEDREVQSMVTRINRLFEQTAADTERSVHDYAIWDDSYAFVAHPTPKFVEDNLSQDVLSNLRLSDDFILDRNLRVVAGKSLPPGADAIQELDPRVAEAVRPLASGLLQGPAISASSLVQVGGELRLAAACRVLPTRPTRPFNGIFVHVKRVDAPLLQSFSHLVEGELSLDQDPALVASFAPPGTPFRILERTPQSLRIALPVRDSQGRVLAVLESPFPRTLRLLAHRFMLVVYASLFAVLAAFALLLSVLLRRVVLDRLETIHAFVVRLGETRVMTPRLPDRPGDELDALATGINRTLDSLEGAQRMQQDAEQEQRRIEEQLFQNQKFEAIATMAGGIAHDFNNGLSCILGSLDLLQDDLGEEHPGQRHIERMRKAGVLSTTLVRQMLNLTRTGHTHLAFVRLGETVSEALVRRHQKLTPWRHEI